MKKLNIKSLRENKNTIIISTEESLEDINPIEWSDKVINGEKQVTITTEE